MKFQISLELDVSILNQTLIHLTMTSTMGLMTFQIPRKSATIYALIILNVYFLHGIPPQVLVNMCIASLLKILSDFM